jgi:hypothetical protein
MLTLVGNIIERPTGSHVGLKNVDVFLTVVEGFVSDIGGFLPA